MALRIKSRTNLVARLDIERLYCCSAVDADAAEAEEEVVRGAPRQLAVAVKEGAHLSVVLHADAEPLGPRLLHVGARVAQRQYLRTSKVSNWL